jgi:hypothetical protein
MAKLDHFMEILLKLVERIVNALEVIAQIAILDENNDLTVFNCTYLIKLHKTT